MYRTFAVPGTIEKHGNANLFRPLPGAPKVVSSYNGRRAVRKAASVLCKSFGMIEIYRVQLAHGGCAWRVVGTTGQEIAFKIERVS